MKDMDGHDACEEADEAGEQDQSPIVLGRQAG
jgi:hypothetical protein